MPSATTEPVTRLRKLGFVGLAAILFVLHSRVFDIVLQPLHLPSIIMGAAVISAFVSGGVMRAFSNRIGACLIGLSVWMCMAVPFSVWRGHSVNVLRNLWLYSFLVYFVAASLIFTWDHLRKAFQVLAASILLLTIFALTLGEPNPDGRLALGESRFGNPNDLAQILLMGLPFWWFIANSQVARPGWRVFAYVATLPIFVTIAMTGSRGALLATTGLLVTLFLRSPLKHKLQLSIAGLLVLVFAAATLPKSLQQRYFTFFKAPVADRPVVGMFATGDNTATMSAMARWTLLKDSLTLTFYHPLFGVGPGGFDIAQDLYSREHRGIKGLWHHTHNTYTEIASENGIPAVIFYLLIIAGTWRATRVKRARGRKLTARESEVVLGAFCLRLALVTFCVSAFFASFGYHPQLPLLAALAVSWRRTSAAELSGAAEVKEIRQPVFARVAHPVLLEAAGRRRPAGAA